MPTPKIETVVKIVELVNIVFPSVAGIIVSLKGGKQIDLKELLDETDKFAAKKIDEANDFLDRPGPEE